MITTTERPVPPPVVASAELPRLLRGLDGQPGPIDLDDHRARWGALPDIGPGLTAAVDAAGLRGRGGGGFPTGKKLAAVADAVTEARRAAVVVVNGAESEPASGKDGVLLARNPHLVLDGAELAAAAVGATRIVVAVHRASPAVAVLEAAVAERGRSRGRSRRGPVPEIAELPARYVASEETALVHWLNGGEAKPTVSPPRPSRRGVRRRPTLVQNAETLAHVALIGRFGPAWFRAWGPADEPGSVLVTLSGAVAAPGVYELPAGIRGEELLAAAGGPAAPVGAVLVGGYGGRWLTADAFASATLDRRGLAPFGASLGCGAVIALPAGACGVRETARVARWLADQSAGQCGPCMFGLPAIAEALGVLAVGDLTAPGLALIGRWTGQVRHRGACRHPDGAARFVDSALEVFAAEVDRHLSGRCSAASTESVCPIPAEPLPQFQPGSRSRSQSQGGPSWR